MRPFLLFCVLFCPLFGFDILPSDLNRPEMSKGGVAAVMMFQNEKRFLKEWIEYHLEIGVRHFYLYDNASEDNPLEILTPYLQKGLVSLFLVPRKSNFADEHFTFQQWAYNHALKLAKGRHAWLAILDNDEFICIKKGKNLNHFLARFPGVGAIALYWQCFGSSGVERLGEGELQIEAFTKRAKDAYGPHTLFKSIVRPELTTYASIHNSELMPGVPYVTADGSPWSNPPSFTLPPVDEIAIYHYWWRDEAYFLEIKLPRRILWKDAYTDEVVERMRLEHNEVDDFGMQRWVEPVKKRMEGKKTDKPKGKKQ